MVFIHCSGQSGHLAPHRTAGFWSFILFLLILILILFYFFTGYSEGSSYLFVYICVFMCNLHIQLFKGGKYYVENMKMHLVRVS